MSTYLILVPRGLRFLIELVSVFLVDGEILLLASNSHRTCLNLPSSANCMFNAMRNRELLFLCLAGWDEGDCNHQLQQPRESDWHFLW